MILILFSHLMLIGGACQLPPSFPGAVLEDVQELVFVAAETPTMVQLYSMIPGDKSVRSQRNSRPDENATEWEVRRAEYSTSYWITDLAYRKNGERLLVAGVTQDDATVIEEWRIVSPPGSRPGAEAGSLPPLPIPRRSVLYRGTRTGHVLSLIVDVEGRFLIFLSATSTLWYLDLQLAQAQPRALGDSLSIPHLEDARTLRLLKHPSERGRWIMVTDRAVVDRKHVSLFRDVDNDGLFQEPRTYTWKEWVSGPYGRVDWQDPAHDDC